MGAFVGPPSPPRTLRAVLLAAVGILAAWSLTGLPAAAQTGSQCTPSETGLCLLEDRFQVTVDWVDSADNPFHLPDTPLSGQGTAVDSPSSNALADFGYFWFFEPDDVDLVVKVIDGRQINGFFWFFYGSTTNVEYTIRVVDTQTGARQDYRNDLGTFGLGADTRAFEGSQDDLHTAVAPPAVHRARLVPRESLPSCDEPTVTCLHDGRFAVESEFSSPLLPDPPQGVGRPVVTTPTSTILYHFGEDNPGLVVKVLDGRSVNDRYWIFVSSLGGQFVNVTLTDLETGLARIFEGTEDSPLAVGDRNGFIMEPPEGPWVETPEIPGFRFKTRITGGGDEVPTRQETECVPETLCVSGALPGRSELFLRIVGPKPNGYLWPNIVKFSTSQIEVWIEQLSTGQINYYRLEGATPGSDRLDGFFDRTGFRR